MSRADFAFVHRSASADALRLQVTPDAKQVRCSVHDGALGYGFR